MHFNGCLRVLQNAFRQRGYYFRRFREKLRLTPQDVLDRKRFATRYASRTGEQWKLDPHAIIDNKSYPVYPAAGLRLFC